MAVENKGLKAFTAGATLTLYHRVKLNSSNQVVHADQDDKSIGTVHEHGGGETLVNEHVTINLRNTPGTRKVVCAGAVAQFASLRGADGGKVDDASTGGVTEFIALDAGSGNNSIIEALPVAEATGLISQNIANSAAITNTVTETAFDVSKTIDGGELAVGDVLEIAALVHCVSTNSTDTLTLRLKAGTEIIVATAAVDVADDDIGYIHAFVVVRAIGASGSLSALGVQQLGVEGTASAEPFRKAAATEDISGDVAITVTAEWSVANAGNQAVLENLTVIKHRQ